MSDGARRADEAGAPGGAAISPPESDVVPRRRWLSWAWLAPILAVIVVGVLWFQAMQERGVIVQITFDVGAGVRVGDPVRYRGVDVGIVRDVALHPDLNGVRVTAQLTPDAIGLAVDGARFWIVRPDVSLRGVSGLDTLLGPRYIAVAAGPTDGAPKRTFVGLSAPPLVNETWEDTLDIILRGARRGSLLEGSPVYYRDIQVGQIRDVRLAQDATHVQFMASIWPRFAPLVLEESRFWNVSGVGVDVGIFSGVSVRTDSLRSILVGGVAFATPERRAGEPVSDGHVFTLEPEPDEDWLEWEPVIELTPER